MAVKEDMREDVGLLLVSGKLMGGFETAEVHDKLKSMLSHDFKRVIIDLSKVKWLNSQGLGMLMSCLHSAGSVGAALKISGASEKVNSLFMITQLATVFDSYETLDTALAAFNE